MPGAPRPAHAVPVPLAPGRSLGGRPEDVASPLANRGAQSQAPTAIDSSASFSQAQVAALARMLSSGAGLPGAPEGEFIHSMP